MAFSTLSMAAKEGPSSAEVFDSQDDPVLSGAVDNIRDLIKGKVLTKIGPGIKVQDTSTESPVPTQENIKFPLAIAKKMGHFYSAESLCKFFQFNLDVNDLLLQR